MTETAEVLLKKTRNELDEIAVKLGINTASLAKTKIAKLIVEARKKAAAKETPKPKAETPRAAPSKLKEAFKVEVGKQKPKLSIGNKGVYAKCAAIDAQISENNEAVNVIGVGIDEINNGIKGLRSDIDKKAMKMHKDGASMLQQGIKEMCNGIDAQIKANKKAAANMEKGVKEIHTGIKEMQTSIDRKADEIQDGIKVMYSGVKVIQTGIQEMGGKFEDFRNEAANYKHDFYYG